MHWGLAERQAGRRRDAVVIRIPAINDSPSGRRVLAARRPGLCGSRHWDAGALGGWGDLTLKCNRADIGLALRRPVVRCANLEIVRPR